MVARPYRGSGDIVGSAHPTGVRLRPAQFGGRNRGAGWSVVVTDDGEFLRCDGGERLHHADITVAAELFGFPV